MVSGMTFALVVGKADPNDYAAQWVKDNSAVVDSWMK